jgi:hypothetical protein
VALKKHIALIVLTLALIVAMSPIDTISAQKVSVPSSSPAAARALYQKTITTTRYAYNGYGEALFRYRQKFTWTYNGTYIKGWTIVPSGKVYMYWSYLGYQIQGYSGGLNKKYYEMWTHGVFYYSGQGYYYLDIDQKAKGNGGWTATSWAHS